MRRILVCFVSAVFLALFTIAHAQQAEAPKVKWPGAMSHAVLQPGSAVYNIGSAVSTVLTKYLPTTFKTAAFTTPIKLHDAVHRGIAAMGNDTDHTSGYGWIGKAPLFERRMTNELLMTGEVIFDSGWGARGDAGITSVTQMKGLRLCWGYKFPNMVDYQNALLRGLGWTKDDFKLVNVVSPTEAVRALIENRADVGIYSPMMGIGPEAEAKVGIRVLNVPTPSENPKLWEEIRKTHKGYNPHVWKAGMPGVPKDTRVIAGFGYITINRDVPDELVYQMVKTLWEHVDELQAAHPFLRTWSHKTMALEDMVVPYHPGSIRFFKEQGVWTERMEKNNNALQKMN